MDDTAQTTSASPPAPAPARPLRLPSIRASALLAALMLAIGVAAGAAIGPAPDASFAGGSDGFAKRLPGLLAAIIARSQPSSAPASAPPTPSPQSTQASSSAASPATSAESPAAATPAATGESPGSGESSSPSASSPASKSTVPAVTSVWLIELSGGTLEQALAQPSAAPYIDSQLAPASTTLSGWSALDANAFASEAALLAAVTTGGAPPLVHSIVQPPCPEGAAGASCATGTPGQLTAADSFLKATLAQITNTLPYREHGLVVVTFATVGIASQSGLPEGASNATLTSQPPAGVLLLSPFAKAGAKESVAFNPTSPKQSLERLLH